MSNTATKLKTIECEIAALQDDIRNLESGRKKLQAIFQQEMSAKYGICQHDRLSPTKAFRTMFAETLPKSAFKRDWRFWAYELDNTCHLIDAKWKHEANVPLEIVVEMREAARKGKS